MRYCLKTHFIEYGVNCTLRSEMAFCVILFKLLVLLITLPLLLAISIIGIILWILLLPFKIICCPAGCIAQCMANLVETFIKLPVKAVKWVAG